MSSEGDTRVGRVKWFNTKAGYGFVSYTDADGKENDIFAHHSAINTAKEQFRYLVQGEYIHFSVEETEKGGENQHSTTAGNITGINGGMLMCETRSAFESRDQGDQGDHNPNWMLVKRGNSTGRGRGRGRGRGGGRGRSGDNRSNTEHTPHNSFDN